MIFKELRAAYRASQDTYLRYARDSLAAAHTLARDFRAWLGAPETYPDPDDDSRHPYVRLLACHIAEGAPAAAPPESPADLLTREPDGFWRFALALILDRDIDSFPKQSLVFFLRLKLHQGEWQVQLLDGEYLDFRISAADDTATRPLFDHMVGMLERLLATKPWDGVEKLPIGFDLVHPRADFDEPDTLPEAP